MKKIKEQKGITIIALIVTIILILILTSVTITSTYSGSNFRRYKLMCDDIELLEDKVLLFYRQYGQLPVGSKLSEIPEAINNGNDFYGINTNRLNNLTLNFGAEDDVFIIDSETFEVYYQKGIEYDGTIHYTN